MPIELGTFDVIIGMDWLADNDAVIICGKKEVHIPIKNRTLVVKGDSNSSRLKVISCIKARKYIERGCHLFLAYVIEKEKSEKRLEDVPVIRDFPEVFPDDLPGLPPPRQVEFKIDLVSGAAPVARAPYRLAPSEMKELSEQLKELLEKGFIRPSSSPWGAPVLFVKKKDGSFRMCIDYRELNKLTVKNRYPLPNMRFIRSTSRFKCIFKRIDLLSRGIINSAFEKRISPSQPLYERLASKDHFGNLLKKEKLNPNSRMRFWLESVQFLGHVINREGVHVDPAKIEAIKNWPVPTSPTEKRYSVGVRMRIEVFQKLKQDLCTAPILALPEGLIDFVVYCDASLKGYGAVLMQRDKVIAYASWQLKTHEKTTLLTISNWVLWFLPLDSGDITSMNTQGPIGSCETRKCHGGKSGSNVKAYLRDPLQWDSYLKEVVCRHGVPLSIISDRGIRFASGFWRSLQNALGTNLNMSTTYHSETDGQSERTIQTLEDMLRAYVIDFGGSWDRHLPLVEFSYNNSYHASIKAAPFEALYGRKSALRTEPCYIHLKKSSWTINCSSSKPWKCYGSREVKQLKQSRIPIVKVRWNSWRGPEFTWEREDFFMKKYPHLFPSKKRGTCHNRAPGNVASRKDGLWATVKAKTINGKVQLQVLVYGKKIIITKLIVRRDLQLEYAEGIDCLPNATIFEQLTLMGYEKVSQKLTFYKAFFSPQWKFLIHTDLQCLSAKTTAWNEFSSTMTSSIICLATNQKFNFSKYIFESTVKNLENVSGKFLMYPRFVQVFLEKQLEGMSNHKRIYVTPHLRSFWKHEKGRERLFWKRNTLISNNGGTTSRRNGRRPKRKDTEIPQSSGPADNVADEVVNEEMDDSLERAATTATSLDAEHDRGNIDKTQSKATPNEPSSLGTSLGGGPRRQETIRDTIAQTRVSDLENIKTAQALDITSLKLRVKKLEKKGGSRTHNLKRLYKVGRSVRMVSSDDASLGDQEDASKQRRKIDDIDKDAKITLIDETQGRYSDDLMFDTGVLNDDEVFIGHDMDEKEINVVEKEVSTADPVTTAGEVVTTTSPTETTTADDLTLAQTLIEIRSAKSKVKGVVIGEQSESTTRTRP
ncbi:putative reverse transcriptase domain-containing protein [Tanacetum coccineum]|uniref:Reverse transcriptase domain-containing protein n=1 Tax=Tanacetum coccineum TaxID=301880 RepID=A0ABQ5IIR1_9ASTR